MSAKHDLPSDSGVFTLLLRHASSSKRRVAVMSLNDTHDLAEEAAKLGLGYVDTDAITAFNKNKRKIKHWGTSPSPATELLYCVVAN
jgi:hypothetical protein